jgi:hypothetical protein
LSAAARRALLDHDWPGNVRELRNHIQRALARGVEVEVADLGLDAGPRGPAFRAADRPRGEPRAPASRPCWSKRAWWRGRQALGVTRQALSPHGRLGIVSTPAAGLKRGGAGLAGRLLPYVACRWARRRRARRLAGLPRRCQVGLGGTAGGGRRRVSRR